MGDHGNLLKQQQHNNDINNSESPSTGRERAGASSSCFSGSVTRLSAVLPIYFFAAIKKSELESGWRMIEVRRNSLRGEKAAPQPPTEQHTEK